MRARRSGTVYSHRLVMERLLGRSPEGRVDHQNGDRLDNRRENLREATPSQHAINRTTKNATGYRWVYVSGEKFAAGVKIRGRRYTRGGFATAKDAYEWALATANNVHGTDAFHKLRK